MKLKLNLSHSVESPALHRALRIRMKARKKAMMVRKGLGTNEKGEAVVQLTAPTLQMNPEVMADQDSHMRADRENESKRKRFG
jgi:hypothetical protein